VGRTGEALHPPGSASKLEVGPPGAFSSTNRPGNLDVMHDGRIIIVDDATCLFRKGSKVSAARLDCQVETLLLDKVGYGKARRRNARRSRVAATTKDFNTCINVLINNLKLIDT
jgi:hypothetical protein